MKQLTTFASALILCSAFSIYANNPPVVDAGKDTTVRLGWGDASNWRFYAKAVDDSTEFPNCRWTQLSGPTDGIEFGDSTAEGSSAAFRQMGVYTLRLTADDGRLSAYDDIVVTVIDSIAFKILAPKAGDTLRIGQTYTVQWQMDPPASVLLEFSSDSGMSFPILIEDQAQIRCCSYDWAIPADLGPSDGCKMRIRLYFRPNIGSTTDYFVLAPASNAVRPGRTLSRPRFASDDKCDLFGIDGRRLVSTDDGKRAAAHGIAVRRNQGKRSVMSIDVVLP